MISSKSEIVLCKEMNEVFDRFFGSEMKKPSLILRSKLSI